MKLISMLAEISIYSVAIVIIITVIKKAFGKKMTAAAQFSLWLLLIMRLLMPVSLDGGVHFYSIPDKSPAARNETVYQYTEPDVAAHSSYINNMSEATTVYQPETNVKIEDTVLSQPSGLTEETQNINPTIKKFEPTLGQILIAVWLTGVFVIALLMGQTYLKLNRRIKKNTSCLTTEALVLVKSCKLKMNVDKHIELILSDNFESTMLFASIKPKLIIPKSLLGKNNEQTLKHCLLHELAHYKRRDYLWYLLINAVCVIYWFNPAVWVGTRLMKQDMETACDAHVVRSMSDIERNKYAATLLTMFTNRNKRFQVAMGMGFATKKEAAKRLRGIYMKRKMKLRTTLTLLVTALLVLFTCFTTACQPGESVPEVDDITSEDTSVQVSDDNEPAQTEETSEEAPSDVIKIGAMTLEIPTEAYTVPDHWTDTVPKGTLVVDVDTDIMMPDTEKFPVVNVKPITFAQEEVDKLIDYFAPDGKYYEYPRPYTKADYEEQLKEARKGQYVDDEYVVTTDSLAWVAVLEERQANAPEDNSLVYVDTTLTYPIGDPNEPRDLTGGENFLSIKAEIIGQPDPIISVRNYVEGYEAVGANNITSFTYSEGGATMDLSHLEKQIEEFQRYKEDDPEDQSLVNFKKYKAVADSVTMKKEEALQYAQKAMSDIGLTDMFLINAEKATLIKQYNDGSDDVDGEDIGGYEFKYIRGYKEITGYFRGSWGGNPKEEPPAYLEPYEQEIVNIFVSEDGVQSFTWQNCVTVTEEISDSVKLLPFEQIQDAVLTQIYNKNVAPLSAGLNLRVKLVSAGLHMGYISMYDSLKALYVPVWVFEVINLDDVYSQQTGETEKVEGDRYLIVINAIDGGAIDRYTPD